MKVVTLAIDLDRGLVTLESGKLFLGELVTLSVKGYTPSEGSRLAITLFDDHGTLPLADNSTNAAVLDLRGKDLRRRFTEGDMVTFRVFVRELDAEGNSNPHVKANGRFPIYWSPFVFEVTGEVATMRGEKGDQGPAGRDGQNGKDGRDGRDGPTGPEGPMGPQGLKGESGVSQEYVDNAIQEAREDLTSDLRPTEEEDVYELRPRKHPSLVPTEDNDVFELVNV